MKRSELAQACLVYQRPLQAGETLRYEFLYQPNDVQVHPALGDLAFLLEPAGTTLHWVHFYLGGVADKAISPAPLPLKAGEWNQVELTLTEQGTETGPTTRPTINLTITLNGTLAAELPLGPDNDRRFGLFHFPNKTAAQVRNLVLTGNWPQALGEQEWANLLEMESPDESVALQRARHRAVTEAVQADNAYNVWHAAQSLPDEARYRFLCDWVLPTASRRAFRLQAEFSPIDQPLPTLETAPAKGSGRRLHVGGQLVAPALELVRVAASLKRLDELKAAVQAGSEDVPDVDRNVLALEIMIAVAAGETAEANEKLQSLLGQLQTLDPDTPVALRFAELVAVAAALEHAETRGAALPLAELLVENQQGFLQGFDQNIHWQRYVHWLRARGRWLNDPLTAAVPMGQQPTGLSQWTSVSHPTAQMRGRGLPSPSWRFTKGKVDFFTGHGADALYFQSPLAGDFEVRMRSTTSAGKEIRCQFAAIGIDLAGDGKSYLRHTIGRDATQHYQPALFPAWGPWADFRLVVKDGVYTVFINDLQVHTEKLGQHADPWLTLQSRAAHFDGGIENLRILGSPTVPDVLQLSAAPHLLNWRANDTADAMDTEDLTWIKQGDEIIGNLHAHAPGSKQQSLLQYHRPMLEDGEIQYEFFHEAGKTEVHPALDRLVLMLTADGAKVHYLTDGPYDRSGLAHDNLAPLAGSPAALPLKDKDWNQVALRLAGNTVTVMLNGEKVADLELEPTNQRTFGLFRYADVTTARVRNVSYRGNWPKQLPLLGDQELASP